MAGDCKQQTRYRRAVVGAVRVLPRLKWPIWLLLTMVCGPVLMGNNEQRVSTQQGNAQQRDVATVEVSLVTVEPKEIHLTDKAGRVAAAITVQIFHSPLTTEQTVRLNVGNFTTDPPAGVAVTYEPPSQTVRLPPGPSGVVTATAKIPSVRIGDNKRASVVIVATLTSPTPGINVVNPEPELPHHQAILKIEAGEP